VLAEVDTATFAYLKTTLQLTDGNLGRHLETLAAEQLVTIRKGYEGRPPAPGSRSPTTAAHKIASEVAVLNPDPPMGLREGFLREVDLSLSGATASRRE
jgi:Winged helix DNA-binding domain